MRGSGRQLKERLQMIVKRPKRAVGACAVLLILMVCVFWINFTGRNERGKIRGLWVEKQEEAENVSTSGSLFSGTDIVAAKEKDGVYGADLEREEAGLAHPLAREEGTLVLDLNFDGWDDLCYRDGNASGVNIPYYCMLWNEQRRRYEYSAVLYNVEADPENQWVSSRIREAEGLYATTYYRYDDDNQLHMVRYVEEYLSGDKVEKQLDLTYVDDGGPYTLSAVVDESELNLTMIAMAKQALYELYAWTGEKIDTAYFQVSNVGGVVFGVTAEDIEHSRIFLSRYFGADTEYNISGYDKSISSIGVASGREFWFSPVLWKVFPKNVDEMTDEEVIAWYFERLPMEDADKVKTIEQRYEDMWTVQAQSGKWFEVIYNTKFREVYDVTGPYPSYPEH